MKSRTYVLLLLSTLFTTGCVSSDLKPEDPKSKIAASISATSPSLNSNAHLAATNAEHMALEKGAVGAKVEWSSGDNISGSIIPGQNFKIGSSICRRYQRVITQSSIPSSATITACKGADGIWAPID